MKKTAMIQNQSTSGSRSTAVRASSTMDSSWSGSKPQAMRQKVPIETNGSWRSSGQNYDYTGPKEGFIVKYGHHCHEQDGYDDKIDRMFWRVKKNKS